MGEGDAGEVVAASDGGFGGLDQRVRKKGLWVMGKLRLFAKEYHPIVHTLLLGEVILNLVQSMCYPFLAIYLTQHKAVGLVQVGFMMGAGALAGTVGGFVGGAISDRLGRRKVMLASLLVGSLVYAGYVLTVNSVLLFVLILVGGFCGSFFDPTAKALMADLTVPEKRVRVFSLRYMAVNLGFAVGPMIGGWLGIAGEKGAFFVMAGAYLVYLVVLQVLMRRFGVREIEAQAREKVRVRDAWRVIRMDRVLLLFLVGGVLSMIVYGRWSTPMSQYLADGFANGTRIYSWILTVNGGAVILLQPLVSRWVEKRTPIAGVMVGSVLMGAGMLMFAVGHGAVLFLLGMLVFTVGEMMLIPSEYVLIDQITPEGMRGTYYGAASFTGLGNFFGPWICTSLLAAYGGPVMFVAMAGVAVLGLFVFRWGHGRKAVRWAGSTHKSILK